MSRIRSRCRAVRLPSFKLALAAAAVLAFSASSAGAQQVGRITGRVTETGTARPVNGAQVSIVGTGIGTITDTSGRFLVLNVPIGEAVVRVTSIGYAAVEQPVTVAASDAAVVDFELSLSAVDLEEIIVTGTPGATKRRAIGTSVSSIDVEDNLEAAPITSVSDLLSGRDAGVVTLGASGTVGTASSITLRGMTSMSQQNDPIIYVDGIRINNSDEGLVNVGGQKTSRLNDIAPENIARIEVIRGAAATTLYGSEASNGVIQIFTKQGRTGGEPVFNASVKLGINRLPAAWPLMHPDPKYPDPNEELIGNGLYQEYYASARGGAQNVTYFASGNFMDNEGSFPNNYFKRATGRVNLGLALGDFSVDISTSAFWSEADLPINDNVITGVLTNIQLGDPVNNATPSDPWGGAFYPVPYALDLVRTETYNRFIGGVTLGHELGGAVTQRLTIGLDMANGEGISLEPYAEGEYETGRQLLGGKSVTRRTNIQSNIDYAATWTAPVTASIGSELSVGVQLFTTRVRSISASGDDFPAPGLADVDATARPSAGESEISYATGGLFINEQLSFGDILYLIGGLRVDGSSVFGEAFGLQPYPKLAASYVISDEEWFDLPFSSLRLRAGFGMAGTQPGAFDALRTYSPFTANEGQIALRAGNPGNDDLAPEVSQEFEAGFDAGFFDGRLSLTATGYFQRTKDALLDVNPAPSLGFTSSQSKNVGEVRNRGLELMLDGTIVQEPSFGWTAFASYAYNDNEVTALPGAEYIAIDRYGSRIVEGYSISSKWEYLVGGDDEDGLPVATEQAIYLGPGVPPHNGSLGTQLRWRRLTMTANAQWAAGHVVSNLLRPYMYARRTGAEYWSDVIAAGGNEEAPSVAYKQRRASCCYGSWYEDGDWLKLRELSLAYSPPATLFGGLFGSAPQFYVSARNLFTLTGYSGVDPELSASDDGYGGTGHSVSADYFTVPQSRQFIFGMDVTF